MSLTWGAAPETWASVSFRYHAGKRRLARPNFAPNVWIRGSTVALSRRGTSCPPAITIDPSTESAARIMPLPPDVRFLLSGWHGCPPGRPGSLAGRRHEATTGVFQHLGGQVQRIDDPDVDDGAVGAVHGLEARCANSG